MKPFNDIANTTLTAEEKARMRRILVSYMEMKPIRGAVPSAAGYQSFSFFAWRPVAAVLVFAVFVSTAGISYAQNALPGDLLYAIKTNLNEPIAGALAVSAKAKSDWAINVATSRIEEAATLAAEGKLDTETQETLKQNFATHASLAAELLTSQADTNPDTSAAAAVSFEAQLSEYERVLTQVGDVKQVPTETLASSIRTAQQNVGSIRANAEAHAAATSSDSTMLASRIRDIAKKQLKASLELAQSADTALEPSSATEVAVQLSDANNTLAEGDELLTTDAPKARGAFQNALSAAEKLSVFLKTSTAIHSRTGLTIRESKNNVDSARSTNSRTLKATTGSHPKAAAPIKPAAATLQLQTTGGVSAAPAATSSASTTVEIEQKTTVDMAAPANTEAERGQDDDHDGKTLPLSVPQNFLH